MPLHGKIVVIKRSGKDGTEFPLTASCLFGRTAECDIRIQLPQVSKEHCRIDLNENKEIILTNLSSANPTRVNGETLTQSEHLKHGDVITIVDRSFRFEYAPTPTPKKRTSSGAKSETLKVLRDQQVSDGVVCDAGEKRISEVSTGPRLKDGANYESIQRSLEKTLEMESPEESDSPFSDLYKMIKKSMEVKTPRKSSASEAQTPSKLFTPRPAADPKAGGSQSPEAGKKRGKSFQLPSAGKEAGKSTAASQQRASLPPQRFTASEVIEQITASTSSVRRRSKESTPVKSAGSAEQGGRAVKSPKTEKSPKKSPKIPGSAEKGKVSRKRKSEELGTEAIMASDMKRKRVSFGGHLSPELFDKRLPPDSPLRRGASPRRSFSLYKPTSLLRRASVIGLLKEQKTPSPKKLFKNSASPKTTPGKAQPKSRSPSPAKKSPQSKSASPRAASPGKKSPKTATPAQKSPKSRSPSPKPTSPAQKSPKSRSPSPKPATPAQKSPKSRSPSPKPATPAQKTPKSRSPSAKPATPAQKTPKSRSPSPKSVAPGQKTPKSRSPSAKPATPAQKTPKSRSPSPKSVAPGQKTPKSKSPTHKPATPAQKSPKSRSSSPKLATPRQKSPKSRSASPKPGTPGQKTPKSRSPSPKQATPAQKNPKSRSASPKASTSLTPAKTPLNPGVPTPSVQGRFSVSRIRTPSPKSAAIEQTPSLALTPKIPLRRKSMKSASRRTPGISKSAVKVLQRRSGISRASIKVKSSWANIVKFGQTKTSAVALTEKKINKKPLKKTVSKPKTPARKPKGHPSTGHADSPATIVVGKAHKRIIAHPAGAAPKVVMNALLFKKDMKMDEDLTGLSEMFQTPVNERRRRSLSDGSAKKTPARASTVEPSVLNTPEEPDEMMVSPLSVASTIKSRRYNSEAVQRLLGGDEESSFVSDAAAFTGVETIMKTPTQKAEAVEDLGGKLLKTPKQKPEQQGCLTGVKRIMKTPRQKVEPVEDLRGKLLKTPKQKPEKPEQRECLTGVKRIMKTPRQKAEPIDDIRGNLLVTPKQKAEQQECLTGVKRIFKTPKQKAEPIEDLRGKLLKTPRARKSSDMCLDGIKELLETPIHQSQTVGPTPNVKRGTKVPKEKNAPVEDMVGLKRLLRTPKQRGEPVANNFGIKRLMKSPRVRGNPPVEDFEGLQDLMEEPPTYLAEKPSDAMETHLQRDPDINTSQQQPAVETLVELPEPPEDVVESAPARGRRAKKPKATAPPTVRQTRGRIAEVPETKVEESLTEPSTVVLKPGRGKRVRGQDEATEPERGATAFEGDMTSEPTINSNPAAATEGEANGGRAPVEKAVLKVKRGRKPKKTEEPAPLQQDLPKHAEGDGSGQMGALENVNSSDDGGAKLPDMKEEAEMGATQKKSVQGQRAKPMETEKSDSPAPAPGRGRRGKKVAAAPPSGKQSTRTITAKSQESTFDLPSAEAQGTTESSMKHVTVQESETSREKTEVVTAKPIRGRRAKATVESEKTERPAETPQTIPSTGEQNTRTGSAKSQEGTVDLPAVEAHGTTESFLEPVTVQASETSREKTEVVTAKPIRARRAKATVESEKTERPAETPQTIPSTGTKHKLDVEELTEVTEDASRTVETKPTLRAKRGRNAQQKQEEAINDNKATSQETAEPLEAPKKAQRKRKAQQDPKPNDSKSTEIVSVEEATSAKPAAAAKPRGRGQKVILDPVVETATAPPADTPEEPERGRKGAQITGVNSKELPVPSQVVRSNRARGLKREVSQTVPAKRGRRGAEEPEFAPEPVVPPKRGRWAAAKPKEDKEALEAESSTIQDLKKSKKSVKLEPDLEVREILKATQVKAMRGRKSKNPDLADAGSENGPKEAEEEKLLGNVADPPPARRGRRGAEEPESAPEPAVLPKRGRRAAVKPKEDEEALMAESSTIQGLKTTKKSVQFKPDLEVREIPKATPVKAVRGRKSKHPDPVDAGGNEGPKEAEEKKLSGDTAEPQPARRGRRGAGVVAEEAGAPPKTRRGRSAKS